MNSFPLSVHTQMGRLRIGFEYLTSLNMVGNAFVTALLVLGMWHDMQEFGKDVDHSRYLTPLLYLLRPRTSTRSHSHTSLIFTMYGFLGKRLCTFLCIVWASCSSSQYLIASGGLLVACCNFFKVPNEEGRAGSYYSLLAISLII